MSLDQLEMFESLATKFLVDDDFKETNQAGFFEEIKRDLYAAIKATYYIKYSKEVKKSES